MRRIYTFLIIPAETLMVNPTLIFLIIFQFCVAVVSDNVLLMRSRGSLTAAIWRSPNDRQGVKRISFVICSKRECNKYIPKRNTDVELEG